MDEAFEVVRTVGGIRSLVGAVVACSTESVSFVGFICRVAGFAFCIEPGPSFLFHGCTHPFLLCYNQYIRERGRCQVRRKQEWIYYITRVGTCTACEGDRSFPCAACHNSRIERQEVSFEEALRDSPLFSDLRGAVIEMLKGGMVREIVVTCDICDKEMDDDVGGQFVVAPLKQESTTVEVCSYACLHQLAENWMRSHRRWMQRREG